MEKSTIGAFDAKNHFSELLDRALHGGETIVTKHGKPIAKIVPFLEESLELTDVLSSIAVTRDKVLERGGVLKEGESWKELAREGLRS
jgi:prevent-host-death family protein